VSSTEVPSDHFPSTHATWIAERVTRSADPDAHPALARAARDELNAHVMQRYFAPLRAYVQGSGWRGLGESADLVNGFFASRLDRADYLLQWRDSGLPLRRWLMNGLLLHLHERSRAERRQARRAEPRDPGLLERVASAAEHDADAERAMDRAWAEAVVEAAVRDTVEALGQAGRAAAWQAFRRHFVDGVAYDALARETGSSAKELKAQVKLVQRWLRAGIERVLQQDGVAAEAIEAETDRLVAMLLG
jgi:hypothetical protein